MGRGIDSRNRVWNWVAKPHRLTGRCDNPLPAWFLAPIAGLKLPTLVPHWQKMLDPDPFSDPHCGSATLSVTQKKTRPFHETQHQQLRVISRTLFALIFCSLLPPFYRFQNPIFAYIVVWFFGIQDRQLSPSTTREGTTLNTKVSRQTSSSFELIWTIYGWVLTSEFIIINLTPSRWFRTHL